MFDTGYKIILYPLFKLCEKDKTMLQLKNITKDYKVGNEKVHALRGVSIDFRESEFVSILGQSGCGKTTLLNIIGGIDRANEGSITINGEKTEDMNEKRLRKWNSSTAS